VTGDESHFMCFDLRRLSSRRARPSGNPTRCAAA
jgi:hypothetical protein